MRKLVGVVLLLLGRSEFVDLSFDLNHLFKASGLPLFEKHLYLVLAYNTSIRELFNLRYSRTFLPHRIDLSSSTRRFSPLNTESPLTHSSQW